MGSMPVMVGDKDIHRILINCSHDDQVLEIQPGRKTTCSQNRRFCPVNGNQTPLLSMSIKINRVRFLDLTPH